MSKQGTLWLLFGVLIGVNLTLGAWLITALGNPTHVAIGATADTSGGYSVGAGQLQGRGNQEALYLFDHNTKKLAVYAATGNRFELLAVRDTSYDWNLVEFPKGKHSPSVQEVKDGGKAAGGE